MNSRWIYRTPGISDELFVRGNVPMTKEEVRVITLAKARMAPHHIVWDIGAGTGSLSIEAALQAAGGFVYAVERSPVGVYLIQSNRKAFGLDNLKVIEGAAPEALDGLPDPDRVFVGGSGGHLAGILESIHQRLLPGGRIVVNAVTLETAAQTLELLQQFYGAVDAVQISVARLVKAGASHLLKGMNPVTVLSAEKRL
ncbi:MAG TPA: precorrin-6Y C5,15-methyltransferase (decarboxylating) subunit CbiT [Pelotomaculum sp.]|nr:precorrin-6Y C5,15-methyltransferase (decarboxylating) subunit CbiT [Pelotomaculum sp.]